MEKSVLHACPSDRPRKDHSKGKNVRSGAFQQSFEYLHQQLWQDDCLFQKKPLTHVHPPLRNLDQLHVRRFQKGVPFPINKVRFTRFIYPSTLVSLWFFSSPVARRKLRPFVTGSKHWSGNVIMKRSFWAVGWFWLQPTASEV